MEFGPRALGNRSILADPRNPKMKDIINKKIKRRESFRPFAPSIIFEDIFDALNNIKKVDNNFNKKKVIITGSIGLVGNFLERIR